MIAVGQRISKSAARMRREEALGHLVLVLSAQGKRLQEVADIIGISLRTASRHFGLALQRYGYTIRTAKVGICTGCAAPLANGTRCRACVTRYYAEYRKAHRQEARDASRRYQHSHRDKLAEYVRTQRRDYARALEARQRANLADSYIRGIFVKQHGIPNARVTPQLIELKRADIQLQRLRAQLRKEMVASGYQVR